MWLLAHVLGGRSDLPLPPWLFAWGASIVLIVSFVALSVGWKRPLLQRDTWRPARIGIGSVAVLRVAEIAAGALSVGLLVLAVYAGLAGKPNPATNFTLTFVFVTVWIGFPLASVVLGDVFRLFSPWRAVARVSGWLFRSVLRRDPPHLPYPGWLGYWPAVVGLFAFIWLELITVPTADGVGLSPENAAEASLVYTAVTLAAMALFGAEAWSCRGETFAVLFGMFARLSAAEIRRGRPGLRRLLSGAPSWPVLPGSVALVVGAISTTSFDGAQEGILQGAIDDTFGWFLARDVAVDTAYRVTQGIYLFAVFAAIAGIYLLGVLGMRMVRDAPRFLTLARSFAHTLIPIALAYLLAHYFSLLFFQEQAQFTYLLSDPLGTGTTDIFGTGTGGIDYTVLSAEAIWYVQVGCLVAGHVAGLVLAHDRAVALWGDYRAATRSQYWMLAVMVLFTCFGLFLLSEANE